MVRVKVCCISSKQEANMAVHAGADALGLVGNMPSGPGVIGDSLISDIAKIVPPPIATFLLTSETNPEAVIDHLQRTNTSVVQLVDAVSLETYRAIRKQKPMIKIVQVIHVLNEQTLEEAQKASEYVDALLLDSGNPNLKVKVLGGTGKTHNWTLSRRIVESVQVPVFLAGGLNVENVREAIETVKPFGVDLCSGVRTGGHLDKRKLDAFFAALKG